VYSTTSSVGTIQAGSSCQESTKASVRFRSVSLGNDVTCDAAGWTFGADCVGTAEWNMAVVFLCIEEPAAPSGAVIAVPVTLGSAGDDKPFGMTQRIDVGAMDC